MTRFPAQAPPEPVLDLLCAGESMVMFVPDPPGPFGDGMRYRPTVAGAESNVAAYAAALGLRTAWLSQVGNELFGDYVVEQLSRLGVDTALVRRIDGLPTAVAFKQPSPQGTRVSYYRRGSAASHLGEDAAAAVRAHPSRILHLSGITPALSQSCRSFVVDLASTTPSTTLLSFDVNWRPTLWGDSDPDVLLQVARAADIVFVGDDEAEAIWGLSSPAHIRELLPEPDLVVVKQGAAGATAFSNTEEVSVPSLTIPVVEPVGAGDAFAAGFLVGTHRDLSLKARVRLGTVVAAAALRVSSDVGPLPSDAVMASLLDLDDDAWQTVTPGSLPGW